MKKNNVRIKENITLVDEVRVINDIVDKCFLVDNDGFAKFVPYYRESAIMASIADFLIEGLEFDEKENILESIVGDKEIESIIAIFKETDDFKFIMDNVLEMIDYRKTETLQNNSILFKHMLRGNDTVDNKVMEVLEKESLRLDAETKALKSAEFLSREQAKQIEYANKVNESFTVEETTEITKKMAENNFDPYKIAEIITDKYLESDKRKENVIKLNDHKKKAAKKSTKKTDSENVDKFSEQKEE